MQKNNKPKTPAWTRLGDEDRFVPLYLGMLRSPAWHILSQNARSIYIVMRTRYNPIYTHQDTIRISYSALTTEAKVRRGSIKAALEELEEEGFISIEAQGMRTTNVYKFVDKWKKVK